MLIQYFYGIIALQREADKMRFKKAREAKGLSQKYVALTLGVKPPNISRWESGVNYPTVENLIALAHLYECSIDYLLENF